MMKRKFCKRCGYGFPLNKLFFRFEVSVREDGLYCYGCAYREQQKQAGEFDEKDKRGMRNIKNK